MALAVLAGLTYGIVALVGGYAVYLRSPGYRNSCATVLSRHLGLPAEIGRVVPRSHRAQEYRAVRVWLPDRRGEAAFCERAVVIATPRPGEPGAYELELRGGRCDISTRTWLAGDYRTVLESGLRPGFAPGGPRRVLFSGMDLTFEHDRLRATLDDAGGLILFDEPGVGRATVTCERFNGQAVPQPVVVRAEFAPTGTAVRLARVELTVPDIPLRVVGLADLAGLGLHSGSFGGRAIYQEDEGRYELTVSGRAQDLVLSELTALVVPQPWRGTAPRIELEELRLVNGRPERFRFSGELKGAVLGDVFAPWGLSGTGGSLSLRIDAAELSSAGVERLVAAGRCEDLSLETLSETLGWGAMSGQAAIVIDDLTVTANRLTALDATIAVNAAGEKPNWVERRLLSEILKRTMGIELLSFLPERFEYARLGARLDVENERLHVFGTHGPRERAILSVRLADQEVPVIFEPEQEFDLQPWFDGLRAELAAQTARVRSFRSAEGWWPRSGAASRPASGEGP